MPGFDPVPLLALLAVASHELLILVAIIIVISGFDDLAIDCVWIAGTILRPDSRRRPLGTSTRTSPGSYAIFIPTWDESDVIDVTLRRLLESLDHPDFTLFVGVYPNDPGGAAKILAITDQRLQCVNVGHPGPTTKADCLNALWRAMLAHERKRRRNFTAVVLHDAEDVVHPSELKLFDRHMPALAMVQLPVLPLADPRSRWISGHYMDEFAENHGKDMDVRAFLGTAVPSAGVATAIDRDALFQIANASGRPFDETSLTEDYELGHKLKQLGLKGRLVREREKGVLIATREFFPATLETAVRQKSRWLTGIALAGWDRLGWQGSGLERWMLLRDRKGVITAAVGVVAYALFFFMLMQLAVRHLLAEQMGVTFPPPLGR